MVILYQSMTGANQPIDLRPNKVKIRTIIFLKRCEVIAMPVYEYQCKSCSHQFEKLRSMRDADELILCLKCSSKDTHRMLSRFNAKSEGRSLTDTSCGCGGCTGGSCGSCGSHNN